METRPYFLLGDLLANVQAAGFTLTGVQHVYLDVVKTISATA